MDNRFVSSTDLEEAKRKRAEEWKAVHERLGQSIKLINKDYILYYIYIEIHKLFSTPYILNRTT